MPAQPAHDFDQVIIVADARHVAGSVSGGQMVAQIAQHDLVTVAQMAGDMERQAKDIANRKFTTLKKLPWALELHAISKALNSMCHAVELMLGEQTALAEKMRQKAYVDQVTGLMNRNDFSEKLVHLISTPQDFPSGVLAIVRVNGFTQFNEKNGRPAGDQLLQKTAQLLGKVADSRENVMLARMDGPEFAMMVPEVFCKLKLSASSGVMSCGSTPIHPRTT